MIQAQSVTKAYGNVQALDGLSLSIEPKSIFALLGQNGAGKTTFVKAMLNLVSVDNGSILLMGKEPKDQRSRKKIAYLPEKFSFFPYYTVEACLNFYRSIKQSTQPIMPVLKKVGIEKLAKRKLRTLSKGQLQRLGIATTLIGDAELLIWDEPFTGLDPLGIKDIKEIIKDLREEGKTLFLNSHILSEIEKVCTHLAIINEGTCIAQGEIDELKKESSLEDYFCNMVRG